MSSLKKTALDVDRRATILAAWPKHLISPIELVQALHDKTRLRIIRSPLSSRLILQFIGSWSFLLAHVLNRSRVYNKHVFDCEIHRLEKQNQVINDSSEVKSPNQQELAKQHDNLQPRCPLITLSNHISCIDDPVLWAVLLPLSYYFTNTDTVRWSGAAVDICFSKPWHASFFSLGKTFPIFRGIGLDQPAMDFALALLKYNQWLHLFPEGRVMRDQNQEVISNLDRGYVFKWGISKLILDYLKKNELHKTKPDSEIRILPFYHLGMDKVLPVGWPYLPRFNKRITVYIRPSVIKLNEKLLDTILATRSLNFKTAKSKSDDDVARIKLTHYLEEELEALIIPATIKHESS